MKITETHAINNGWDEYCGKGSLTVTVEDDAGKKVSATICAGEPEDAVFFRDLDGAFSIADAVRLAYEAGKRGEEMTYVFVEECEGEDD
ncbi:hypothetical protein PghCCS26_47410 [Paenibacillus glycanilyticus]|uniref:Uncharacterized protein n=1 Tax=Paenibacillus glycanilyticus TaxID=126569 RepID=A0ABQ6NRA5_9BACL|nr:hypothetical protein [Paenibacillus glycanilyticus]GMK47611.1 hypothetical protein PghCCS26_47410 [Paenibacillus glycanilyticus]